jgi:hypothetical protein
MDMQVSLHINPKEEFVMADYKEETKQESMPNWYEKNEDEADTNILDLIIAILEDWH